MLGANHQTTTTGSVFRPDIWSKEIIRATEANLVLADKVWRFDQDVVSKGKTVTIPQLSNLVANDKLSNTEVVLQSPTEGSVTLTINQHKHTAFLVEDILATQSQYSLLSEYTKKAAYAIKRAVDTSIANLATGFSTAKGAYNTTITTAAILGSVQALDDADAPLTDRVWVLKPKAVADLRTISDYTRYDGTGYAGAAAKGGIGDGSAVKSNGQVGMLYNAPVLMSTQIAQSGNNISNMYFHKEAIALAMQKAPRVQSAYVLQYLGDLTVADVMYGLIETRDAFGVELKA